MKTRALSGRKALRSVVLVWLAGFSGSALSQPAGLHGAPVPGGSTVIWGYYGGSVSGLPPTTPDSYVPLQVTPQGRLMVDTGSVSVAAPALNVDGGALSHITNFPATQPVSGSVGVSSLPPLPPGANSIGSVAVSNLPATQAVSAASLPLPTGAATSALQPAINADGGAQVHIMNPSSSTVSGTVSVSNLPATQAVSAAALPLPVGAATSASQPALHADGGALSHVTNFPATQTVSGSVSVSNLPATQPVSGSVGVSSLPPLPAGTNALGSVTVSNLPATQAVSAASLPLPAGAATAANQPGLNADGGALSHVTNFPSTQAVSGSVAVSNFPATQPVSGSVSVSNLPTTQAVSAASLPLPAGAATAANQPGLNTDGGALAHITNFPSTQSVSGSVSVSNLPSTQAVSAASLPLPAGAATAANQAALNTDGGALSHITNFPATQPVSGSVSVSNLPATQVVSGSVGISSLPPLASGSNAIGSVSVSNLPSTQPVSAASLPLPSGAATAANQPALNADGGALSHITNFPSTQAISGSVTEANSASILSLTQQVVSAISQANGNGTAPANALGIGGTYFATTPSLYNGQFEGLRLMQDGSVAVSISGASNTGGALPVTEPDAYVYTCTASAVGSFSCTNSAGTSVSSMFATAGFSEASILATSVGTNATVTVKGGDDGSTTPILLLGRTPEQMTARPFTGNFNLNAGQSYHIVLTEAYFQPSLSNISSGSVSIQVTFLHRVTPGLLPPGLYYAPSGTSNLVCNTSAYCQTAVTKYQSGAVSTEGRAPDYRAGLTGIVPLGGTTISLAGNAANAVSIKRVTLSCSSSASSNALTDVVLTKRTTADSGGTSTTFTAAQSDANDPVQTSVLSLYTAAPTTGTGIPVASSKIFLPGTGLTVPPPVVDFTFTGNNDKPVTLRGTAQSLDIGFIGAQPNGACDVTIVWDETIA